MNKLLETRQSWLELTTIQIGGALCLPVIMIGQVLVKTYGIIPALVGLFIGNIALFLLGIILVTMTLKTRSNTIENAQHYFGPQATRIFAFVFVLCLTGWFAIQLNLMSLSLYETVVKISGIEFFSLRSLTVLLGILITVVALRGISALDRLATISMPLLISTMAYALFITATNTTKIAIVPLKHFSLEGVCLVIVAAIAAITDIPTYYRFAKTKRDALISLALVCLIGLPVIELVGVYLGAYTDGSILDTFTATGGPFWQVWVALFLLFAGWTTNNTNLYSSAISLETLAPNISYKNRILLLGLLGTVIACFQVLEKFEFTLEIMGIFIASMAAVMTTRFVFEELLKLEQQTALHYSSNIIIWGCSLTIGITSACNLIYLTGFALLDTWLIAIAFIILHIFIQKSILYYRKKSWNQKNR
jgi:cytosine permease